MRCIIIEDERPAQEVLRSYLAKTDWIELTGVFDDALTAIKFLTSHEVDIIFLDIQIPVLNGVEFLKSTAVSAQVIITSAYSQYAIEAFELDVRDYLMKPFSFERFLKAVDRISRRPAPESVHHWQSSTGKQFTFFNVNKTMVKVTFDDVLYVESMREYVYIHLPDAKVVTKCALSEMETILGHSFIRIHRSFVVNAAKVTAYNAEEVWIGQKALPLGTHYKQTFEAFFPSERRKNY